MAPAPSVVVGGSGVLGRAICTQLPGVVWNLDRGEPTAKIPERIRWVRCDVAIMGEIGDALPSHVRWLVYAVGGPDEIVARLGRWHPTPWWVALERHLIGAAIVTGEALRRGVEAIVYLGSVYGSVGPDPHLSLDRSPSPAYCAAKAGLMGLARWLAANGVRANVVSPTGILGAIRQNAAFQARLKKQTPLRRLVTPEEVAQAVRFCLEHKHLAGQEIILDGGWLAR